MAGPAAIRFTDGLPSRPQYGERIRLFIAQGPNSGVGFCLMGDRLMVGREGTDIALSDPNISRNHLELRWNGTNYAAKDLGSANGFLLNKKRVLDAVVKPGDILLVGVSVIEVVAPGGARGKASAKERKRQTESEKREKAQVAKKRTLVMAAIALLVIMAHSASEDKVQTFRERGKIEIEDEETKPKKKIKKEDAEAAIREVITGGETSMGQRQDANRFFKDGVRDFNNHNYRRSILAFETALTVDPSHNTAKLYLKSAKRNFEKEIKDTFKAAVKAHKALRFNEAKMHYENVLRALDDDKSNEMYIKSTESLKQMEKELGAMQ
jgi:pSer/pThr/pTyr-binding forkhead associated (FHA) protein